jgi:bifunctional DNA-binding transcriptional regulator/antitoxin component of YhaV-PrlF toxin-antitoxin module
MEGEKRKLIKFSNYSLCITLPKWVIKKLKWEKGEEVNLFVDDEKGEILISKDKKPSISAVSIAKPKPTASSESVPDSAPMRW